MRYNWKVLSCSEYPDHWPWTPLSSNILAQASGHTVPRDQLMLEEYPTFSYLEHSPDLLYFLRLSLFWCCCDLLYRGKWGEVWRQICLLPNFLAAANPQKEAPPNWKRNSPTFGQVLFFMIISIHFLSWRTVHLLIRRIAIFQTRPSALGMSDPIWGPLIHIFVDEKKKCGG